MKKLKAYKFALMPTPSQIQQMTRFAGSCRFVYNKALALQKERHKRGEKKLSYVDTAKLLTQWRHDPETLWLADAPVHPLQQALKNLDRAYTNFFAKRAAFPRFKKKGLSEGFRYPDSKQFKVDSQNSRVFLPKLGWMRYRKSQEILGTPKNITVSLTAGRWMVSIQTEQEVEIPTPQGGIVGLDMGVKRFVTLSDGSYLEPLNSFKNHETRLKKAQQSLSRKKQGSANWQKAKRKVGRIHTRIANARKDYLHKASHTISQAVVCIEDLQIDHMSKSATGKGASAKSGLNKAILDQGWGEFRRQLDYKLAWKGGHLIAVPPKNTSRTCPECGHISAENRKTQAQFACTECGFKENADFVGALNVLRAGHAQLACQANGEVVPSATGTRRTVLAKSARTA